MKAVRIHADGGEQLRYEDVDGPQLQSPDHVIVRLYAAAVNHIDFCSAKNDQRFPVPRIPGAGGAGTVAATGSGVNNLKPGDAVCIYPVVGCGRCPSCDSEQEFRCEDRHFLGTSEDGTYAEYARVPAKNCYRLPTGLSFQEAVALPLGYATVWRMLFTHGRLKPGESVLIIGAGGIAGAALQLASAFGASVCVASRRSHKLATAIRYGARHGINSGTTDLAIEARRITNKRGFDVVINSVGGETWRASLAALARGGRLVTCGVVTGATPPTDLRRVFWNHLRILATSYTTRLEFRRVLNFFDGSGRRPIIDRAFPLAEARRAQQSLQHGESFGRIVLSLAP